MQTLDRDFGFAPSTRCWFGPQKKRGGRIGDDLDTMVQLTKITKTKRIQGEQIIKIVTFQKI